ncbi:hypothetical protein [Legionella sp. km772]|uniref:hypothetical protein n=1 Tax=Legionella sp. km772 TaxID=2498111 RepID=UPI000F8D4FA5|nr:hypothetical protein [Legionella sp. km772]RUR12026.1 hypothetical protein ELY15_06420 [Legionella sp. km772]
MGFSEYRWVSGQSQIRAYRTVSLIKNIALIRKTEAQQEHNPLAKLGIINLKQPAVVIDRVNETAISVDQSTEHYWVDEGLFNLINEEEFSLLAQNTPGVPEPEHLWNRLLGQVKDNDKVYKNRDVHYLTEAAGEQILHYWHKFQQGIDFQHLPKGFHLITNPATQQCEVLHYSPELKEAQKLEPMPLSVTLDDAKPLSGDAEEVVLFSGKKEECYRLLLSKIKNYCSKEELSAAFKYFSALIEHEMGLSYEDFFLSPSLINADINPIVLLGRWETVMSNPQLKKMDRLAQWKALSELSLSNSYESIRALTDYLSDDNPCGFLLPEMELHAGKMGKTGFRTINDFNQLGGYVIDFEKTEKLQNHKPDDIKTLKNKLFLHVKNSKLYCSIKEAPALFKEWPLPETLAHYQSILQKVGQDADNLKKGQSAHPLSEAEEEAVFDFARSQSYVPITREEASFWRYLAYQPKRNSIEFYKKAIACIHNMKFKEAFAVYRWNMYKLLAACTTQKAHKAETSLEEEEELQTWQQICTSLSDFENNMPYLMKKGGYATGLLIEGKAVADYIHGNISAKIYPNLAIQQELFAADLQTVYSLELKDIRNPDAKIKKIDEHRFRFAELLDAYSTALYEGARFYRQHGEWRPLSIQEYTLLQYELHTRYPDAAALIIPHLSTFNISQVNDFKFLSTLKRAEDNKLLHAKALNCAMSFWKDALRNTGLHPRQLANLFTDCQTRPEFADEEPVELNLINYLEKEFPAYFPTDYFATKRQLLKHQAFELTEEEKKQLRQYQFKPEQRVELERLQVLLKQKQGSLLGSFVELNERLSKLRYLLPEADFNFFLHSLVSLGEDFLSDTPSLIELIKQIQTKRTIAGFSQLAQCLVKMPNSEALLAKFVFFIKEIKPLIALFKEKGELALETMDLEEGLALLLLAAPQQDLENEHFKEDIQEIIHTLNRIAKVHAISKPYLLYTLKSLLKTSCSFKQAQQWICDLRQISQILYAPAERPLSDKDSLESAQENMLTFYSLLAHYCEKPSQLMKLLRQLDKFDPCLQVDKIFVGNEPWLSVQDLASNSAYLRKVNNEIIEYRLSNEEGQLQPPHLLTQDNCNFFAALMDKLSPALKLAEPFDNILFELIKKRRTQGVLPTLWSFFKKEERLEFILLPLEAIPEFKKPHSVYLSWDKVNDRFNYLETDAAGLQKSQGIIERNQLNQEDFNALIRQFNPTVHLPSDLNNRVITHLNELSKQRVVPVQKRFLLSLITHLLGNQKSITGLEDLLRALSADPKAFSMLMSHVDSPPYPDIKTIHQWIKADNFKECYRAYSVEPYGRRELSYAFQESYFHEQKTKYQGIEPGLFSKALAQSLNKRLQENRQKSLSQLQAEINQLRLLSEPEFLLEHQEALLCLCIEMLARTTGQKHPENAEQIISQEVNTTQVMTLYAMLATDNPKLISQIDAGEGKSRVAMILAACQSLRGKTVDIITSDMELAERDYLTYTPFFNSLGVLTSLITINTPPELYQKNGINFSDDRQLFLLRNQSDILGKPFAYLQENKSKRCLILDEEDVFRHNKSTDLYNYAMASARLKSFAWIYSHLVKFMQEQLVLAEQNKQDRLSLDSLALLFVHYVQKWEGDAHYRSLLALKKERPAQISTWLNSAYQAIRMKEKQHYAVTENNPAKMFSVVDAHNKTRLTRKVLVLDQGRSIEDSTFGEGIHQCLCALENQKAKDSFVIFPENATARSSLTTNFIAQYREGQLYGISGSTRSEAPLFNKAINHENYHYLVAPRHKPLQREDKPIWLAKDEQQQIQFLKKLVIEKLKRNWPILIICKNDIQSQTIYNALTQDSDVADLLQKQQWIHALSSSEEKKEAIEHAGEENVLTVSTVGNFGRGKDIFSSNEKPLLVLVPYVPTFEDEIQIAARTARNGKTGEFRMVPHLQDSDYPFKGDTGNVAQEIQKLQGLMAIQASFQEEVSKLYADFIEETTQLFLNEYHELKKAEDVSAVVILLEEWSNYLNALQKDWQKCRKILVTALETRKQEVFSYTFQNFVDKWLLALPSYEVGRALNLPPLSYEERSNKIYTSALLQSNFFKAKKHSIKVQHRYDPADDGQARIYDVPFAQLRAVLSGERHLFADYYAWKEGRGELFPDLMAAFRGERPLFANLLAIIDRWLREIKSFFTAKTSDPAVNEGTSPIPMLS